MKYLIFGIAIGLLIGFYTARIYYQCPEQKQYVAVKPYKPNNNKIDSSKKVEIKIRQDVDKIVLVPTPKLKQEIKQLSIIDTTCVPLVSRLTEQIDKRDSIIDLQKQIIDNQSFQIATLLSQKDSCLATNDSLVIESNNLYSEKENCKEENAKLTQTNTNNKWGYGMGGTLLGVVLTILGLKQIIFVD